MKISVKETSYVHPSQDTPKKTLWCSDLDLLTARFHVPTVYLYKNPNNGSVFETQLLKEALSKVLVDFYPVAGRLRKNDASGRIELCCNEEGVLFVEAEADISVGDLKEELVSSRVLDLEPLVPLVDYSQGVSSYPLVMFQVTHLKCGGVCLGVGYHHTLADGPSAIHFINSWSDMVRGIPVKVMPFIDRDLLRARVPPSPEFHHVEYDPPPVLKTPNQAGKPISVATLKITPEQIGTLKSKYKKEGSGIPYSTYVTLAAHIWRSACKARCLNNDQQTKLVMSVDGRSRLVPPLPVEYLGNVLFIASLTSTCEEVNSSPLDHTMNKIQGVIKRADNYYLKSALDYLDSQSDLSALVRGPQALSSPNLHVMTWTRLPLYDADFGWGRPFYMGRARGFYDGKAWIMPNPVDDGSLLLLICLNSECMPRFERFFYEV